MGTNEGLVHIVVDEARGDDSMVLLKSAFIATNPPSSLVQPQVSLGFDATVVAIAVSVIGTLLAGSISWAFGRNVKSIDARLDKQEAELRLVDHRHRDHELNVANNYLKIDDHIRHSTATEAKIDSLHRKIDHLMEHLHVK